MERPIAQSMVLGDDKGPGHFRGITGIVPRGRERNMFIKRQAQGVITPSQQISIIDVPATIDVNTPTNAVTDTWVSWPTGMAMGALGSLSILKGFNLVANLARS